MEGTEEMSPVILEVPLLMAASAAMLLIQVQAKASMAIEKEM